MSHPSQPPVPHQPPYPAPQPPYQGPPQQFYPQQPPAPYGPPQAPYQQPPQVVVHQQGAAPAYPRSAKTGLNHTPHIILDVLTGGLWLVVHIPLWLLSGRKTKFK